MATPLKVPPPTRTFAINPLNYQASSAGGAVPWTAPRVRRGAWIDLGCWRWDPGTVASSFVSTRPLSGSRTDHFCVPTAQRTQARADGYRWLLGVAMPLPRRVYLGHRYTAPALHQHSPAQALLQVSVGVNYTTPDNCIIFASSMGTRLVLCL